MSGKFLHTLFIEKVLIGKIKYRAMLCSIRLKGPCKNSADLDEI